MVGFLISVLWKVSWMPSALYKAMFTLNEDAISTLKDFWLKNFFKYHDHNGAKNFDTVSVTASSQISNQKFVSWPDGHE